MSQENLLKTPTGAKGLVEHHTIGSLKGRLREGDLISLDGGRVWGRAEVFPSGKGFMIAGDVYADEGFLWEKTPSERKCILIPMGEELCSCGSVVGTSHRVTCKGWQI